MTKAFALAALCVVASCGGSTLDPRYPAREASCPVKSFPGQPAVAVDDLGTVAIECASGGRTCERQALDAVCKRGGDVAWGFADNALTSTTLVVHAAHTRRALEGPRERGCNVQVFTDTLPTAIENIGAVTSLCSTADSREVCLREIEDQVCLLGGNVLWQAEGPTPEATSEGNKLRMRGRAAHTK
jgi:hypothetical protein